MRTDAKDGVKWEGFDMGSKRLLPQEWEIWPQMLPNVVVQLTNGFFHNGYSKA